MSILIDKLLQTVINQKASDLHISVGQPPVLRLHGHMTKIPTKVLEPDDTVALMKQIAPERCQQQLQEVGGSDFGFAFGDQARFRVSIFKQKGVVGMVLRIIPNEKLSPEKLGLPWPCVELVKRPRGLFLVTGPTGSGKSTSLAGLVDYINETVDHHIITIEDPIEFYHVHKKSTINQREVGVDVPSFSAALRAALRQDPDVILVGEMRDLETIEAAITAAETGHVVFGTLHTNSAEGTVNRIIDVFPNTQQDQIRTQLASSIIGIMCQQLLPKIGGGRTAAFEMLVVTPAIANLIRENKIFRITSSIQTGAKYGMQLLDDHLFRLWKDKICTKEDVLGKCNRPDDLIARIARAERGLLEDEADEDEDEEDGQADDPRAAARKALEAGSIRKK
jgi:twitching motility protein PilT